MHYLFHALIIASYLVIASAAAVALPAYVPWLSPNLSPILGAVTFLFAGFAHFLYVQSERHRLVEAELVSIRRAYSHLAKRVETGHGEADRLSEALAASRPGDQRVSDIVAEVKVLQRLVEKFQAPPGASSFRAASSAGQAAASANGSPSAAAAAAAADGEAAHSLPEQKILEIVRNGIRLDRVEVFVQPVVRLPQRKLRGFECYTRIRDEHGQIIVPEQYIDLARREGLVPAIDNLLLFRTVQMIRRDQRKRFDTLFFCNVAGASINDTEFFSDFIDFVAQNDGLASKLVFEFRQHDLEQADDVLLQKLGHLAGLGFRFCLDGVRHINFDLSALARDQVKFIKIDAHRILEHAEMEGGEEDLQTLKRRLDRAGVDLIVEKIETEKQLVELLDFAIDYGEGFLFGEPRRAGEA